MYPIYLATVARLFLSDLKMFMTRSLENRTIVPLSGKRWHRNIDLVNECFMSIDLYSSVKEEGFESGGET